MPMAQLKTGLVSQLLSPTPGLSIRSYTELNTAVHGANLPNWKSLVFYFFFFFNKSWSK